MADEKGTWKRFQRLRFDSKSISKRARQAETKTTKHAHKFVVSKLNSLQNAKKSIVSWLAIVGVVMAAVALQTLWYQQSYQTTVWGDGGTYAEGVIGPINTLNPLYSTTEAELSTNKLLFSSIYRYDTTNHLADDLATNTTISKNERIYTITLRDDAYWSDGVKLTADDVVYTVNLMKSPEVRSVMFGSWTDIEAESLGPHTVQFTLPSRYAAFSHALTFSVLPKHVLESVAPSNIRQNTFSVSPVSSGPFKIRLLQLSPDGNHKIANMLANTQYHRGVPRLSRFAIHAYNTQEDITDALRTGEINAAIGGTPLPDTTARTFTTEYIPVNGGVYALLNTQSSILKDKNVRKALQVGTDTAKIRQKLSVPSPKQDLPFANGQLFGPGIPKAPITNPAKAKSLLQSAGWTVKKGESVRTNKSKQELELNLITTIDPDYNRAAEEIQNQWSALGIKVSIDKRDPDAAGQDFVQTTLQPRNYDVLIYKLIIGADPDVYAYWHSSQATRLGYNFSNYSNDVSDDSLSSARARSITELRNEKYKDFAAQWLKDVPAVGLYQAVEPYHYGRGVQPVINKRGIPNPSDRYGEILYWSGTRTSVYKTP